MSAVNLPLPTVRSGDPGPGRMVKVIDQTKCIGCHACTTACKSENSVPVGVTRTYVKSVDVGVFPQARRAFQVTRCNQCEDAPCVTACPTAAMHKRPDGIVDFDKSSCIGCKACMAACPYDAIFINPDDHCAEKCNFCAHRLDIGLEPACVVVCPTGAIMVGDVDDPSSAVSQVVNRSPVAVRRPEKATRPKLYYKGAHQATLDPLAAAAPSGDSYAWAEKPRGAHIVDPGHPDRTNSSAAAILNYDVAHRAPWDYRVSLYTWTKGIGSGAYIVAAVLLLLGRLGDDNPLWTWGAPILSAVFLFLTAVVLVWDLEHPERFLYILTRPQWRSWLVRGGIILSLYAAVLAVHVLASMLGWSQVPRWLAWPGIVLALGTAVYTAYLFAQAKARDLWQSPLLAPHMAVQAVLAGAAAMVPLAMIWSPDHVSTLAWITAGAAAVHLLFVLGEVTLPHPTAHAKLAAHTMTHGRYAGPFWGGLALVALGLFAPLATPVSAWLALAALVGLLLHEHAYVQSGQSVPLA